MRPLARALASFVAGFEAELAAARQLRRAAPSEPLEPPVNDRLESIGRLKTELVEHTAAGRYLAAIDVCDLLLPLVGPAERDAMYDVTIPKLRALAVPERRGLLQVVR